MRSMAGKARRNFSIEHSKPLRSTAVVMRSYRQLRQFQAFLDRFEYLKLSASLGDQTFGYDRYLNQDFYRSNEWRRIRRHVIARDNGLDLGIPGYEIFDKVYVHHMNPILKHQLLNFDEALLDPDQLITCSLDTHNAIHYGSADSLTNQWTPRQPYDTKLW